MNAIIVDDEPRAIELLRSYLSHFAAIRLVATFRNGLNAFEFLTKEKVDLVFLDINMPHISGISLSKMIPEETRVVFTTAYSEYAVESYEVQAVDYLLKPISLDRFTRTMAKLLKQDPGKAPAAPETLLLKSGSRIYRIHTDEIKYLEKDGNYMTYHLADTRILTREPVHKALEVLPASFLQVHKSFIVNLDRVTGLEKEILYLGDIRLPVGATFKARVLELLTPGSPRGTR